MKTIAYLVILGIVLYSGFTLVSGGSDFINKVKSNQINQLMMNEY